MNREVIVLPFELRKGGTSISTSLSNCKGLHSFADNVDCITARTIAILHFRILFFVWSIVLLEPLWGTTKEGGFIDFENPENNLPPISESDVHNTKYLNSLGYGLFQQEFNRSISLQYPYKDYYEE